MPASAGSARTRRGRAGRALIWVEDLPVPFDRRVWNEATTLRAAGWQVAVVCPKGEGARRWHERIDGIEIFRYPLPTTAAGLMAHLAEYAVAMPASLILSLLAWRGRRLDVVHACNPPDFYFPIGRLFRGLVIATWDVLLDEIGEFVKPLIALPAQTGRVLTRIERGELNVNVPQVNRQIFHLEGAVNRLTGSIMFAAFLFGGVVLYQGGDPGLGYLFWAFSGITLFWMLFFSRGHSPWR